MKFKKIITSGCSFSQTKTTTPWPNHLKTYVTEIDNTVEFIHRGLMGQGNELIQKKSMKAAWDLLSKGTPSAEIAIFVMWSGVDRKTFYVENPYLIRELEQAWLKGQHGFDIQLGDLDNSEENLTFLKTSRLNNVDLGVYYNKSGGWYIPMFSENDLVIAKEHRMLGKNNLGFFATSITLECMISLQNFCKSHNIKLYQMFFMDEVLETIEHFKDHSDMSYLYEQIDWDTFISKQSITKYLINDLSYFENPPIDMHPNFNGHKKWLDEVMIPFLNNQHFFD